MSGSPRLLLLGFDAGDPELLQAWAAEGVLPTIRGLLDRGLRVPVSGLPGFYVGATWPTFSTGVTPARHGFHASRQIVPGTYDLRRTEPAAMILHEPFWGALGRAGRRVAILDVPLMGAAELNGIQLAEWGGHDTVAPFAAWPAPLTDEVRGRFGLHPTREPCDATRDGPGFVAFREALLAGLRTKVALTHHFLDRDRWDLFAQVFTEGHCVGHQAWHLHDPRHPRHDPALVAETGDLVRDVYVAIDAAMGEVIAAADPDTTVLLFASHGMESRTCYVSMNQILRGLGVAVPPAPSRVESLLAWPYRRSATLVRRGLGWLRDGVRAALPHGPIVDPARSECFTVHDNGAIASVRVNVVGREPAGLIRAGADLDDFCGDLVRQLETVVNVATGRPVVRRVIRVAEVYPGPATAALPDLLVEWDNTAPIPAVASPAFGELRPALWSCRTGGHHPGALAVLAGPGVRPGVSDRTASIVDLAPTIAALLGGADLDTDGTVIEAMVGRGASCAAAPVRV